MKLRGAVYGCGMISEFHLRAWQRIRDVEIVALCNRTIDRAVERRDRFAPQARIYVDLTTMLASEQLDFLDILTIPEKHREHCLIAKMANLHIICQKPLCTTLEAARELVAEMRDYAKVFAIHENHRYRPWFRRLSHDLFQNRFGEPRLLHIQQFDASEPPEAYKNESVYGVFLEYGSHLVDMMRSILGEPIRVYARMQNINDRVRGESLAHAVYEYPTCSAILDVAWKGCGVQQGEVLVVCEKGEAKYDGALTRSNRARFRAWESNRILVDEKISPYEEYQESFYLFQKECVEAMLGKGHIVQTGDEHLRSLICTFAAYRSAKLEASVAIL